ncbi:helix-turn-helix domain-containing protein [uncultured Oscillibacter sp.]|uniref:helix-turn-helix domain-containing protein n=1 Tax=uncultured Oscillibacter sp. TaxID=876091 RepID=UPI002615B645|nr:helix-turn-helix domain-containing protein [uncultured Oscillibacter sp.]
MDSRERIFAVLDELNMEQKELARLLEIPADTVSAWRRKKSASYTKYLPQIAEALGTTTEYLLTGNGPKKKTVPAKMSDSDTISEDDIKAAFFEGGEDLTQEEMDELWEDAKDYIQYKLEQRRRRSNDQ